MPRIGEVIIAVAIAAAVGMFVAAVLFVRNQGDDALPNTLSEPISLDFAVEPGTHVAVDSWRGAVTVTSGPAGTVHVEVFRTGTGADEAEAFDNLTKLESRVEQEGDTVTARTFRTNNAPAPTGTRAPITITAPADATVDIVAMGTEPVRVEGFSGEISIEAEGAVQLELPRGAAVELVAETATGNISDFAGLGGGQSAAGTGTRYTASRGTGGATVTIHAGAGVTIREE